MHHNKHPTNIWRFLIWIIIVHHAITVYCNLTKRNKKWKKKQPTKQMKRKQTQNERKKMKKKTMRCDMEWMAVCITSFRHLFQMFRCHKSKRNAKECIVISLNWIELCCIFAICLCIEWFPISCAFVQLNVASVSIFGISSGFYFVSYCVPSLRSDNWSWRGH